MNESQDKLWQAVLAAEQPSAEELAQAETELRELEPVAPMATKQVDAMVARATGTGVPRQGAGWLVRRLLAAALLMVSLVAAVSWFGRFEGKQSLRGLEYADAVLMVTEAGYDDDARLGALFTIYQRCQFAAGQLKELSQAPEPSLAEAARRFRADARRLLANGSDRSPVAIDEHLTKWARQLRMPDEPLPAREAALADMGRVLLEGTRALLYCRLQNSDGEAHRAQTLSLLTLDLDG